MDRVSSRHQARSRKSSMSGGSDGRPRTPDDYGLRTARGQQPEPLQVPLWPSVLLQVPPIVVPLMVPTARPRPPEPSVHDQLRDTLLPFTLPARVIPPGSPCWAATPLASPPLTTMRNFPPS